MRDARLESYVSTGVLQADGTASTQLLWALRVGAYTVHDAYQCLPRHPPRFRPSCVCMTWRALLGCPELRVLMATPEEWSAAGGTAEGMKLGGGAPERAACAALAAACTARLGAMGRGLHSSLFSSTSAVLVTPPRGPLSNRLGEYHARNVSNKMCLR